MEPQDLQLRLKKFLPNLKINCSAFAELLQDTSPEGYIMWVAEKLGPSQLPQKLLSEANIELYRRVSRQEASTLPQHIVNAGNMYKKLSESLLGMEAALTNLQEMAMPHVLYLLFAAEGYTLKKFRPQAEHYMKMYPEVIKALPEPYKQIGKELCGNDST